MRSATIADIPAITDILQAAAQHMLAEGRQQWDENYPTAVHVRADIENGVGYVLENGGDVVAYAAVIFDGEPAYSSLAGKWLSDGPYVVVHRLAVARRMHGCGLAQALMTAVEEYAMSAGIGSFKVDTNFDNPAMLGLLRKLGFTYCGDIEYERGSRMAFEKLIGEL